MTKLFNITSRVMATDPKTGRKHPRKTELKTFQQPLCQVCEDEARDHFADKLEFIRESQDPCYSCMD